MKIFPENISKSKNQIEKQFKSGIKKILLNSNKENKILTEKKVF